MNAFLITMGILFVLSILFKSYYLMKNEYPRKNETRAYIDLVTVFINAAFITWILKLMKVF